VGELSEAVSASDEATRFCVLESLKCAVNFVFVFDFMCLRLFVFLAING
jgi:hypothetical protein